MHPDVLEDKKGTCGICGMDLEAVRLVTMYTCPVHAVIEQGTPGKCRICSRDLVQKTAALTFTCAGNREISQLEPGTCADGAPMIPRYNARAHGDHNSKHGGTFFMAPDNWHHIEGTYPAAGRFRVYVYDDFSRPLGANDAKQVRGRVVTKEVFDSKTGTTRELASAPLVLARNGSFFEAGILIGQRFSFTKRCCVIPSEPDCVKTWECRTLSLSKGAKFKNPASTSSAGVETKRFHTV
jgi:hypothetical protein